MKTPAEDQASHSKSQRAAASAAGGRKKPRPFYKRRAVIVVASIVAFFALLQWGGGLVAKIVLNRKLATMEKYAARVGSLQLTLWHGTVRIGDFVLAERDKPDEPPLVKVERASLSVAMRPLFSGKVGGEGLIEGADIFFAKHHAFAGPKDAAEKIGAEVEEKKIETKRWQDALNRALPLEITRFEMRDVRIRYVDRAHQPNVDVAIHDLRLVLTGLQNAGGTDRPLPTRLELTGITTGNGKLRLEVDAEPGAESPRFNSKFELRELSLPEFNTFMRAYVGADVSRGRFEVYSEINAANGGYQGYVKPFFHDLDFKNVEDKNKKLVERAKEKVVSAVASLLKNDEQEKVATVTPFSGTFTTTDVGIWETIHNLLRNAFVEALREGLETQRPSR